MLPPHNSRAWIKCPRCRQAQVCSDWYGGDLGTTEACWNKRFSDQPERILTEHQKAVEEAAGMNIDWGMANAFEAGKKS